MGALLKRMIAQDEGATAIEYALIASLIALVIVGGLVAMNKNLIDLYNYVGGEVNPALSVETE